MVHTEAALQPTVPARQGKAAVEMGRSETGYGGGLKSEWEGGEKAEPGNDGLCQKLCMETAWSIFQVDQPNSD